MPSRPTIGEILRSDRALGLALAALAVAGMLHLEFGQWRPGPGGGNGLMPGLAYWAILIAAVPIIAWPGPATEAARRPLWPMLLALAGGAAYFAGVRYLGIAVSTALFTAALGALITDWRVERAAPLAALAVGAGLLLWGVFTHVAPIITRAPLLF